MVSVKSVYTQLVTEKFKTTEVDAHAHWFY